MESVSFLLAGRYFLQKFLGTAVRLFYLQENFNGIKLLTFSCGVNEVSLCFIVLLNHGIVSYLKLYGKDMI